MPRYAPVDPQQSFPALEQEILERWRERDVFRESIRRREGAEPYVFYEGPPTANGRPGSHHVLSRVFKDVFPRYQTMRGRLVHRKGGWDCHGLPVELEIEKELGFKTKDDIEALRRRRVQRQVPRVGAASTSTSGTSSPSGSASGSTPTTPTTRSTTTTSSRSGGRSSRCGTRACCTRATRSCPTARAAARRSPRTRSALGYKDVVDPSVYVRFPLRDEEGVSLRRLDHHAVDAAVQRRAGRRPGHHLRAGHAWTTSS